MTITWTPPPGVNTLNQTVKKRVKGSGTWLTTVFSPANPLAPTANTTSTTLQDNTVYEIQIDSLCSVGGPTPSVISEAIVFNCASLPAFTGTTFTYNSINPGTLPTFVGSDTLVNYIVYLYDAAGTTLLQSGAGTTIGSAAAAFTGLLSSTVYTLKFSIIASVNSINVSSTSPCTIGTVTTAASPA